MTFNEGMQIDTSTTSTSGGGRGPGRGIAIGGGIGGIIDPGGGAVSRRRSRHGDPADQRQINTQDVEAPGFDLSQCKTGEDANRIARVPCGGDG